MGEGLQFLIKIKSKESPYIYIFLGNYINFVYSLKNQ